MKESKKTTVTLLSFTSLPVETIYCEWQISRTDGPVPTPVQTRDQILRERFKDDTTRPYGVCGEDALRANSLYEQQKSGRVGHGIKPGPFEKEVRKVFEECVAMKVPISETIDFVFGLDSVSIALREQMVRHRVGHKFGGTVGADLIPNLPDSSWWTQSFRQKDMGSFATNGDYLTPDWLDLHGDESMPGSEDGDKIMNFLKKVAEQGDLELREEAAQVLSKCAVVGDSKSVSWYYHTQMKWIQGAYRRLAKAGMPLEDARNVLPLGTSHRLTWKMNLSSLVHVLGNRSCFISQLGMWEPVIVGIVRELVTKVDPFFQRLVDPPCVKGDHFAACPFEKENKEYLNGNDPHLPCPLWTHLQRDRVQAAMDEAGGSRTWHYPSAVHNEIKCDRPIITRSVEAEELHLSERTGRYVSLWGRDPKTGERKVMA